MSKIRITVQTSDYGAAINIGGPVDTEIKSFDIEAPELVAYMQQHKDALAKASKPLGGISWSRSILGVEVLP